MTDARTLTLALQGRWHGRYGLACCPAHGDRHPSLTLAQGRDGRLLLKCHTGCGFMEVLDALRGLGLVEDCGGGSQLPDVAALARQREVEAADEAKRAARVQRIWNATQRIGGTVAEAYLRGRGITCALPSTLRFHPACRHGPTSRHLPALVALVEGSGGFAIHRTYLDADTGWKASVSPAKAMLGACAGGAVRLSGEADDTSLPLVVAEGIETALSLASGFLDRPARIWAALSAPGMQALRLPRTPGELIVAPDGDKTGREAAQALAVRARDFGWQVSLLPAPEGQDWNDVLVREGVA